MYCSRCGAANPESVDVRFCRSCGSELVNPAAPPASSALPPGIGAPVTYGPGPAPTGLAPGGLQAAVFPFGGFWIRLVAYFIDGAIGFGAAVLVGMALGVATGLADTDVDAVTGTTSLLLMAFTLFYEIGCPPLWGATPGKLLLGYHIVGQDGHHIGAWRALARYLGYLVSGAALCLGFLWIGIDSRKQGWHDKIAGTYVVRKEFVRQ